MLVSAGTMSTGPPGGVPRSSAQARCRLPTMRSRSGQDGEPAQVRVARGGERGNLLGHGAGRQVQHEAQVVQGVVERAAVVEDRAVAGDDGLRVQRGDHFLQHADRAGHRAHQHERRAAVEDQVPGEKHGAVREPDHRVVGGVGGPADVAEVGPEVAGVQRELVGEGDERRVQGQVAPVRVVPDPGVARRAEGDRLGPGPLVADQRRAREQAVAERVVAMVMRADHGPHRGGRDRGDGLLVGAGPPLGRAGVDADHALRAGQEPGVVDPPGAVRLDVGPDAVGDLLRLRRARRVDVTGQAAHHEPPRGLPPPTPGAAWRTTGHPSTRPWPRCSPAGGPRGAGRAARAPWPRPGCARRSWR